MRTCSVLFGSWDQRVREYTAVGHPFKSVATTPSIEAILWNPGRLRYIPVAGASSIAKCVLSQAKVPYMGWSVMRKTNRRNDAIRAIHALDSPPLPSLGRRENSTHFWVYISCRVRVGVETYSVGRWGDVNHITEVQRQDGGGMTCGSLIINGIGRAAAGRSTWTRSTVTVAPPD